MIKSDLQLKQDVEAELRWDPKLNAEQIGVAVNNGAVSLLGTIDSYAEKRAAEEAVKRVGAVRVFADELSVRVLGPHVHDDSEIAEAALRALSWDVWVPKTVTAKIQGGMITLEGRVDWNYQRDSAERAVRNLEGVISVNNAIKVKTAATVAQVRERVEAALQRQATHDANSIQVATNGSVVTLSGNASSWHAIEEATAAAWGAPGVTDVLQKLEMTV
jgi:VCBS repeat-containing protein